MSKKILFYGAGAIGRGYLPWLFSDSEYQFFFVDSQPRIIETMKSNKQYTTFMVESDHWVEKKVLVENAYFPHELPALEIQFDFVFLSVGPRSISNVAKFLENQKGQFILCENDPGTVDQLKALTGNSRCYFGVPDVITSNTAPSQLLENDPLAVVSEKGELFLDNQVEGLKGRWHPCSKLELSNQWTAKLFLHNTPHCVAAYLGSISGCTYVHEVMQIPEAEKIIRGSMIEMLQALKSRWEISHDFLEWYAQKELARFSCKNLFDPILRVAREPLRKLEPQGRLVGASQLCLAIGLVPLNILKGITAALLFHNENDSDSHLTFVRNSIPTSLLVTHILGLRKGEALELLLTEKLDSMLKDLESLRP